MTTRKDIVGYGLWFAVVGAMLGGTGGGIYEYLSGISSWNGPVLIMFTAPIGLVCGILYGIWKKYY
jgi:hypothetical protein